MKQIISNFDKGFTLVRNAQDIDVQMKDIGEKKTINVAEVIIAGHPHQFKQDSVVTQSLIHHGPNAVIERLRGGQYFFHTDANGDDHLVSHRSGDYNGFVHTDSSITSMIEHIGHTDKFNRAQRHSNSTNAIRLQNQYSNVEMQIKEYKSGGDVSSRLSFGWDPFQAHIRAVFQLVRLICSNGMVGVSDFMNTKIPVVNNWQEHMAIANAQIQNKMTSIIDQRMGVMAHTPATVRDCQRVLAACVERVNDHNNQVDKRALEHIRNVMLVVDPELHLQSHYGDVMNNRSLSDQMASHLSEFAVWNMLTEIASHTTGSDRNTDFALHKHANELLIDRGTSGKSAGASNAGFNTAGGPKMIFADPDAAFAGDLLQAA